MERERVKQLKDRLKQLSSALQPDAEFPARRSLIAAAFGGSTIQDLNLLSDIFDVCVEVQGQLETATPASAPGDAQLCLTCAAAAAHFLQSHVATPSAHRVLDQFTRSFFLPLLSSCHLHNSAAYTQVATALSDLLAAAGCWSLLLLLLESCAAGLPKETKASKQANSSGSSNGLSAAARPPIQLPVHACCCLAPCVLAACCKAAASAAAAAGSSTAVTAAAGPRASGQPRDAADVVAAGLQLLLPCLMGMMLSDAAAVRKAALRPLLPALSAAAHTLGGLHVPDLVTGVWQQCLSMLQEPGVQRRTALAMLVQLAPLLKGLREQQQGGTACVDVEGCAPFWDAMRDCLACEDALDRKRAAHLLQVLRPPAVLQQPAWAAWTMLHSLLEEFGMHLIKAAWGQISRLHVTAPDFAASEQLLPAHVSGPRNKLKGRKAKAAAAAAAAADGQGAEAGSTNGAQAAEEAALQVGMPWMCVLWQRALQHANPQAQRLALRSFLQRDWGVHLGGGCASASSGEAAGDQQVPGSAPSLQQQQQQQQQQQVAAAAGVSLPGRRPQDVPISFVTVVLLPALTRDFHYRLIGDFSPQVAAAAWLSHWLAAASPSDQRALCEAFMDVLVAKEVPRVGLQQGLRTFAACMQAAGRLHEGDAEEARAWALSVLSKLRHCCSTMSHNHGAAFKAEVHARLLSVAPVVAPLSLGCLPAALNLVSEFPLAAAAHGGSLNAAIRSWFKPAGASSPEYHAAVSALASEVLGYQAQASGISPLVFKELCAQARLLSLLLLVDGDDAATHALVMPSLQTSLGDVYLRAYVDRSAVLSRLILLREVLQSACSMLLTKHWQADSCGLLQALARLGGSLATSVASLAKLGVATLLDRDGQRSQQGGYGGQSGGKGGLTELDPRLWQEVAGADVALDCAALLVILLARGPSAMTGGAALTRPSAATLSGSFGQTSTSATAEAAAQQLSAQLEQLCEPLLSLLSGFSSFSASSPSSASGSAASGGPVLTELQLSRLRAVRRCCERLTQACAPALATTARTGQPAGASASASASAESAAKSAATPTGWKAVAGLVAARTSAQAAVEALLRECAGAAAYADSLQASDRSAASAAISAEKWLCCDAILALAAAAGAAAPAAASSQRRTPLIYFGDAGDDHVADLAAAPASGGSSGSSSAGPAAAAATQLEPATCRKVLTSALDALGSCGDGEALHALRCLRRCWAQALTWAGLGSSGSGRADAGALLELARLLGAQLPDGCEQAAAAAAGSDSTAVQQLLLAVCWEVVRPVCSAMAGSAKRSSALCAAYINTLLLPQLFIIKDGSPSEALLLPLHAPKGPLSWALGRIVDWGAAASRVLLLLDCQLASLVTVSPKLLQLHSALLQRLLLHGTGKDAVYDMEAGQGASSAAASDELSSVAPALDPDLLEGLSGSDAAPRAALVSGLHALAVAAGCAGASASAGRGEVQAADAKPAGGAPAAQQQGGVSGSGGATAPGSVAAAVPAADGSKPKKAPVIIFHDAGDWEDARLPAAAPAAPASAAPAAQPASQQQQEGQQQLGQRGLDAWSMLGRLGHAMASSPHASASQGTAPEAPAAAAADSDASDAADNTSAGTGACVAVDPNSPAVVAGRALFEQLLHLAHNDPALSSDKVKFGSEVHRQKVRLWQALLVLSSFVQPPHAEAVVRAVLAQFQANDPPNLKQYQEALVVALLLKQPELVEPVLLPHLTSYQKHHAGVGSFVLVAAQVLFHVSRPWQRRLLPQLLLAISPWITCHTHNVRTFAQLIMNALLTRFPPQSDVWGHAQGDLSYLRHLCAFFDTNTDILRLRRTIGAPILDWTPAGLAHPRRIFCLGVSLAGQPAENASFEGAPPALMDRISTFLTTERYRLREEIGDRLAEAEYLTSVGAVEAGEERLKAGQSLPDVQRKVLPADHSALVMGAAAAAAPTAASSGTAATPAAAPATAAAAAAAAAAASAAADGLWNSLIVSGLSELSELLDLEVSSAAKEAADAAGAGGGARGAARSGAAPPGAPEGSAGSGTPPAAAPATSDASPAPPGPPATKPSSSLASSARQDIIVVASLIDKLPNLAGLARTCEVFRAAALALPDLRLAADPLFTSISVTAEQWIPLLEVPEAALLAFLEGKQAEGYALIGLEQTAESVPLPRYDFPSRCVLVLGREKEGMPAEVLALLDATVEIPQLGLIRSLNVHVSGAIALYEYTCQRLGLKGGSST